ncbi:hypothetical protein BEN47_15535 [Hymenobacter lapidarius]|uniref:Uncharacterized protein n=1 Tax=Hymenobacter lapidarius TaxID=1908237 RepID=A0A1G1T256_9BACT|nr:hypothetical protein [Hymenobacter lapidarius]OGX84969.1 hypothetical protein BEN47_15535 [Hymenobacter lapidarius]
MTRKDVFAILAVVGLIGGIQFYISHSLNNLEEKGIKTVTVIVSVSRKNVRAAFVGNGRRCEHVQSNTYKVLEGETYALRYDPEDVADAHIYFDEPVYDKREYGTTQTTALSTSALNTGIEFDYTVGNEKYERYQKEDEGKTIDETRPAKVFYKLNNPEIAYIEY